MHAHMFEDIEAKGATRGYNTKYNESMHKSPKKSFLQRGNFRDVAEGVSDESRLESIEILIQFLQILRAEEWLYCASYIRTLIDVLDAANAPQRDDPDITKENLEKVEPQGRDRAPLSLSNIYLGTAQKPYSLDVLQQKGIHNPVFKDFLKRLHAFVSAQPDFGRDVAQKVQLSTMV